MPRLDYKISIGQLLEIGVILIAVVLAWGRLEANQRSIQADFETHMKEVDVLKKQYVRTDVQAVKEGRVEERLTEILTRLERIEKRLNRW